MSNYARIYAELEKLLSEKDHSISPPPSNYDPLFLLLTTKPDLIGFAHLNGEGKEGINRALENFKSLYIVNSSLWANYDLTLVFCTNGHAADDDTVWAETELDPYFCRKFVISLADLHSDLGRLPFIPLQPETVVGLERPPSAQTLMIDCGVSPWLAEALAVPHRLGEKRIVEDCVESPAGVPEFVRRRTVSSKTRVHRDPRTRFKQLHISNFRAYRKSTTFDLDANLVVLYGPNGLGKTSFFDAIDFICTGGVMRFDERFSRKPSRLIKLLRHLDASSQHGFVSADLLIDGKETFLKRTLHDRTNAAIDTLTLNRTDILEAITKCSIETSDMRVENLVRLFRATHLFGQEYQSLTQDLRHTSKLPEDTVSRMLAFQDYVEAISKSDRVIRELTQLITEAQLRMSLLSDSLTTKESELNSVTQLRGEMESPEALAASGKALLNKIAKLLELPTDPQTAVDKEGVKSWRGLLEGRIGWLEGNIADLRAVREQMAGISVDRQTLAETEQNVHRTAESLGTVESRCADKKKDLDSIKSSLNSDLHSEKTSSSKKDALEWFIINRKEYDRIKTEIVKADEDAANFRRQLVQVTESIGRNQIDVRNEQTSLGPLQEQHAKLDQESASITNLLDQVQDWTSKLDRLQLLNTSVNELRSSLKVAEENLSKQRADLNEAEEMERELETTLVTARQSQTDLERILEGALQHVVDKHCPVCGCRHESQDNLENEIRKRMGIRSPSLEVAITSLDAAKSRTGKFKDEQIRLESQIESVKKEIDSTGRIIDALTREQQSYEQQLGTLGLVPDRFTLAAKLNEQKSKLGREIEEIREDITTKTSRLDESRARLSSLRAEESSLQAKIDANVALSNRLSSMVNNIEQEAMRRQVSLNENISVVEDEISRLAETLRGLQAKIQTERQQVERTEGDYGALLNERAQLQQQLDSRQKRLRELTNSISGFETELTRLGLDTTALVEDIDSTLLKNEADLSELESIKGELLRFELALDEVQLSARLSQLKQEIDELSSDLRKAESEHAHLNDWQTYFTKLKEELESVQRRSLKNYIEKYGPLTSSIQKRLRGVYGFGELNLHQEKRGIALRVERKNHKDLAPSDYFSEAQLQIVTLSMFLSAVLTQTWSAFAPILLDDPVTHFDDLNAYSLLDVIRGLTEEPGEGPQFILSTCEERLYRLMRQKFGQLEGKAIFYEFSSIGENGPKVERCLN